MKKAPMFYQMVPNIKEIGKMIYKKEKVKKSYQMELYILDSLRMEKKMERD